MPALPGTYPLLCQVQRILWSRYSHLESAPVVLFFMLFSELPSLPFDLDWSGPSSRTIVEGHGSRTVVVPRPPTCSVIRFNLTYDRATRNTKVIDRRSAISPLLGQPPQLDKPASGLGHVHWMHASLLRQQSPAGKALAVRVGVLGNGH